MKYIPLLLPLIFQLNGCGTAKTQYIDARYDVCQKACALKYSQYESKKLGECRQKCHQKKYHQD